MPLDKKPSGKQTRVGLRWVSEGLKVKVLCCRTKSMKKKESFLVSSCFGLSRVVLRSMAGAYTICDSWRVHRLAMV